MISGRQRLLLDLRLGSAALFQQSLKILDTLFIFGNPISKIVSLVHEMLVQACMHTPFLRSRPWFADVCSCAFLLQLNAMIAAVRARCPQTSSLSTPARIASLSEEAISIRSILVLAPVC